MDVKAFYQIENALSGKLVAAFNKVVSPLAGQVDRALEDGDIDAAMDEWHKLDFDSLVTNPKYIEYITDMGLLYGASLLTSSVKQTSFSMLDSREANTLFSTLLIRQIKVNAKQYLLDKGIGWLVDSRVAKEEKSILKPFESFVKADGTAYFNLVSALHTSRVAAYGFTVEAEIRGYTQYQIDAQLDNRTCEVCAELDGTTFNVEDARRLLNIVLRTDDPNDLKNLQPWPDQDKGTLDWLKTATPKELVLKGWHIPPFHPYCRCVLAVVGRYTKRTITEPTRVEVSQAEFKELGKEADQKTIETWNKVVNASPKDVLTALHGEPITDTSKVSIKKEKDSIVITSNTPAFGSTEEVEQKIVFKKNGNVFLDRLIIDGKDEASQIAKDYMLSLFNLAKESNRSKLELVANLEMGGYAWVKYGFKPDHDMWQALKKDITAKFKSSWFEELSSDVKTVINLALTSDDPAMIYTFADMKAKTKAGELVTQKLLEGTVWRGYLDFNDPEAVSRFIAYMGK